MKFNFGHGLFLGAAAFVIFIFILVGNMLKQDIDLVAENYYEEGLDYQAKINNSKFEKSNAFNLIQKGNTLVLKENDLIIDSDSIQVSFYRPSDKNLDFKTAEVWTNQGAEIQDERLRFGNWKIKVVWNNAKGEFSSNLNLYWQ